MGMTRMVGLPGETAGGRKGWRDATAARAQAFPAGGSQVTGMALALRACFETHLSIMKRFSSMLAMAI